MHHQDIYRRHYANEESYHEETRTRRVVDHVARLLCPKQEPIQPSLQTYDRIDELAQLITNELPCFIFPSAFNSAH